MVEQPVAVKETDPTPQRLAPVVEGLLGFGKMENNALLSPNTAGSGVEETTLNL
jgi:hypothetical protein